jgi:hypothetical protein
MTWRATAYNISPVPQNKVSSLGPGRGWYLEVHEVETFCDVGLFLDSFESGFFFGIRFNFILDYGRHVDISEVFIRRQVLRDNSRGMNWIVSLGRILSGIFLSSTISQTSSYQDYGLSA